MHEGKANDPFPADSRYVDQIVVSPNFGDRRQVKSPDLVILHYTGMKSGEAALNRLCSCDAEVSSHYLIHENGEILQLVAENKRAWHAGNSCWKSTTDINSHSIGIEIVNPGHEHGYRTFPLVQMQSVARLLGDIVERNRIEPGNVLAHSDIAPMRKQDPGELFDWQYLSNFGLCLWVEPVMIQDGEFLELGQKSNSVINYQVALRNLGFNVETNGQFDELTQACTIAFQRHFRPEKIDGVADISTTETLGRLLEEIKGRLDSREQ